ncbi:MAG: metal ABC transporter substrate-binding protein, partial [Paucibacter sp.]|nr:metal ABC transporter substrate-binding protein [Roseateles sp.]
MTPNRRHLLAVLAAPLLVASTSVSAAPKTRIRVGISVGSAKKIFEVVKQVAARQGLQIDVVVFNDYQLPNAALAAGDLDANAFQHKPFLDNQIRS